MSLIFRGLKSSNIVDDIQIIEQVELPRTKTIALENPKSNELEGLKENKLTTITTSS